MNKASVRDIDVEGKRALVRVDFNVPLDEKTGEITDDSRIQATLPTMKYLLSHMAKVILISHLGRPEGKVNDKLRLAVVAKRLSQLLGQPVEAATDCIGFEVEKSVETLHNGNVLLLENVRFHPEEEKNGTSFSQALARLGDIFVNDAFSTSHRAHASITGIANYLPAVAGFLLEKEINTLGGILDDPVHPFAVLLGGAKISDKIGMLENIRDKVDSLLIGGGMAATLLKAKSYEIGLSLVEEDKLEFVTQLMKDITKKGTCLVLPIDVVIADSLRAEATYKIVPIDNIPPDFMIADIGPSTIDIFSQELKRCRTAFWNGPMGIYEIPQFASGTKTMARIIADLEATTVIGGGSTAEAVIEMELADKMNFVSTGGGASLRFLSGKALPGVEVLMDKER